MFVAAGCRLCAAVAQALLSLSNNITLLRVMAKPSLLGEISSYDTGRSGVLLRHLSCLWFVAK